MSIFAQKFGENSLNYAIQLLEAALRNEEDIETVAELKMRLRLLRMQNEKTDNLATKQAQVSISELC